MLIHRIIPFVLLSTMALSCQPFSSKTSAPQALKDGAINTKPNAEHPKIIAQPAASIFGLELLPITDPYFDERIVDAHIAKAKEAGAEWIKVMFFESVIEPKKGEFDFQRTDYVINKLKAAGFKLSGAVLETSPDNVYEQSGDPGLSRPKDVDWWVKTMLKIIDRYKGDVRYWAIWQEPNIFGFSVDEYAKLLKESYVRIKQLDPALKVIMASPDGEGLPESPEDFLGWTEQFLKTIGQDPAFDIIDLHPFRYGTPPEAKIAGRTMIESIRAYRKLFDNYGHLDKELWFTEITWPTMGIYKDKDISISEETQAEYLKYVYGIPENNPDLKITKIFWADVQDWTMPTKGKKEEDPDQNNGLVNADGQPKKSFEMYKALAKKNPRP